jgi:DNA-binding SARP family transcriptional activator
MLRVRLLGTLALEIDGVKVTPPSSRGVRLVLAMLALERRPRSREALAASLWRASCGPAREQAFVPR